MTEEKPTWDEVAEEIFVEHHAAWQRLAQLDTAVEFPDAQLGRIKDQIIILQRRVDDLEYLLELIRNGDPGVENMPAWKETMGES